MRRHSAYFKLFLSVPPPTRKTRNSSTILPNEDTIDRVFLDHVKRMEKPGVYGDNLEIVAFARCYGVDVKIYQREFAYLVSGERDDEEDEDEDDNSMLGKEEKTTGPRRVLHIAYHDWEHYSSVRNIDGPHKGLPNVSPKPLTQEGIQKQQKILEEGVVIMPWMEDVVEKSLPDGIFPGRAKIREALERSKGDVGSAVSRLLDLAEMEAEHDAEGEKVGLEEDLGLDTGTPPEDSKTQQPRQKRPKKDPPPPPPPSKQPPKSGKPKRETARERKERQQKEKAEKKKAKSSGSGKDSKEASTSTTATSANTPSNEGIKTLHV
ncbi:hypothetical protein TWF481_000104 [Arthrobotrys musiformis]|uniref:OTU domain-containing protein n=1 Tax=Arthrobotrys musiformis TaxID=47236 RepID=A0AAV9WNM1_9PEZI